MNAQQKIDAILRDFLPISEAAAQLGITPRAVQAAVTGQRGYAPQITGFVRVGRDLFIPRSWVAARLKNHATGPIPQANRKKRQRNSVSAKDLKNLDKSDQKSR